LDVRTYGTLHLNDDFLAGIDFLILSGESDCGSLGNGRGDEENHEEEGLHFDWEEGGQRVIEWECGGKMKRWYEIYNMRLFWGISKVICSKSGGRVSPSRATLGVLKVSKMVIGRVSAGFRYSSRKPRTAA
jgi:hypothetical protein